MTGTMIFQRRADMTDRATPDAASDTTDLFEIIEPLGRCGESRGLMPPPSLPSLQPHAPTPLQTANPATAPSITFAQPASLQSQREQYYRRFADILPSRI